MCRIWTLSRGIPSSGAGWCYKVLNSAERTVTTILLSASGFAGGTCPLLPLSAPNLPEIRGRTGGAQGEDRGSIGRLCRPSLDALFYHSAPFSTSRHFKPLIRTTQHFVAPSVFSRDDHPYVCANDCNTGRESVN